MPGPRLQTGFSQAAQRGPGQPRAYSWVQTPVEMSYQQTASETIPPLPVMPDSLRQTPEATALRPGAPTAAECLHDCKMDQLNMGTHPADFTTYADATPVDKPPATHAQWRTTPTP